MAGPVGRACAPCKVCMQHGRAGVQKGVRDGGEGRPGVGCAADGSGAWADSQRGPGETAVREATAACRLLQVLVCCRQSINCHCFPSRRSAGCVLCRFGRRLLRQFRFCLSAVGWPVEQKGGRVGWRCRCRGPGMRAMYGVACGACRNAVWRKSLGGRWYRQGHGQKVTPRSIRIGVLHAGC